jgi:hypothetical protein
MVPLVGLLGRWSWWLPRWARGHSACNHHPRHELSLDAEALRAAGQRRPTGPSHRAGARSTTDAISPVSAR